MSNVKVNGNTYNDVTSVKLLLADDSGYAEYKEGAAAAEDFRDTLVAGGGTIGDYESEVGSGYIGWLNWLGGGTVSFPYMTSASGGITYAKFDNLLLPNVTTINTKYTASGNYASISKFEGIKVSGVFDLSSLTTIQNAANGTGFLGSTIGTLKLGSFYVGHVQFVQNATITNFIWNKAYDSYMATYMNLAASITNLYVPADYVEAWQAAVADGTLTKITNVYSIDDWED